MIQIKAIRAEASPQSFTKGNQLYQRGMVEDLDFQITDGKLEASAWVEGSYDNRYQVEMTYSLKSHTFTQYYCECPAYQSYDGMCKHCVAVALEMMERDEGGEEATEAADRASGAADTDRAPAAARLKQPPTDTAVKKLIFASTIRENACYFQPEVNGNIRLVPILHRDAEGWMVEFKIGSDHLYVLKDITAMVNALKEEKYVHYGQKLAFYHVKSAFTEESRRLVDFLEDCVNQEQDFITELYVMRRSYLPTAASARNMVLSGDKMVRFLQAVGPGVIALQSRFSNLTRIQIVEKDPVLGFSVAERSSGGCLLSVPRGEAFVSKSGLCVLTEDTIYLCSEEFGTHMGGICGLMEPYKKQEYYVNEEDMPVLCTSVLPSLEEYSVLKKPDSLERYMPKPCEILLYLDYVERTLIASVYSQYGEARYNLIEGLEVKDLYRDMKKEQYAAKLAGSYFQYADKEKNLLYIPEENEEAQYRLLSTGIAQFQQIAEVYISESLKRLRVLKSPKITMGITRNSGLLDITLQTERLEPGELEGLLSSYRRRRKYYRLKNGDFLELEDNGLSAVAELAEGLELSVEELEEGHIRVPEYRSFYLDQVLRENEGIVEVKRSSSYKAFLRSMKNVEDSDYEVPAGLNAELRPYQKFGFRWLMTLGAMGFGGILADDMGLGKTVQAIAYLVAVKENYEGDTPRRSLIICPASLVYNWESEIHRFAPGLTVETVVGGAGSRKEKIRKSRADILLTSYDLLKRDVEAYQEALFDTVFVDEAQNIKNHGTQTAKAVKALGCARRFALTGTPIENSLSELWSIFDFLMPGFLGGYKHFKEKYEQPVAARQDEVAAERLRRMIRPFILRRLKKEVLKELPDKLEEVVYSRMETAQREIYEARVQKLLDSLSRQSQEEYRVGKLQILAELTHLRQLCCDPSLVYENYNGGAAKVDTCVELVNNAVEAGNKVLLFSQFTSMLDIIRRRLDEAGIGYYILTGSTSKEKRNELVKSFNGDGPPVFLISLKAGGTGLNLTAASIVIHFDPWWNQAAQNQATDRAHRIGQQQVVTVYKLIMKDTLEEKILEMQERKAGLSEEIMADGSISEVIGAKEEFMEILRGAAKESAGSQ
ncbi:SNF2 helicase associated domain-containing protein [Hungatella sp. L12]|uniref:SNF2 helicase associated domain-containing protein n=1 Tax=Hungatella hominis TaxID=2763050 RepID=A0ABR7H8W8_9FIRM|nr:DEAD/DEAH box helicase [Hungatella hominis]MBC5709657.1 SNF2 helicase associated domain-containing protein [Hungatella hominis]